MFNKRSQFPTWDSRWRLWVLPMLVAMAGTLLESSVSAATTTAETWNGSSSTAFATAANWTATAPGTAGTPSSSIQVTFDLTSGANHNGITFANATRTALGMSFVGTSSSATAFSFTDGGTSGLLDLYANGIDNSMSGTSSGVTFDSNTSI